MFSAPDGYVEENQIEQRFKELFNLIELRELFKSLVPQTSLFSNILDIDQIDDVNTIAEMLHQLVGDNFLNQLPMEEVDISIIRKALILKACEKYNYKIYEVIERFCKTHTVNAHYFHNKQISDEDKIDKICNHQYFTSDKEWKPYLTESLLRLPLDTIEKIKNPPQQPQTVVLQKRSRLKSLHDYQYQSVAKIISMLSNKNEQKKAILINLPTGAGKTRLTIEGLVEWLNLKNLEMIPDSHEQQKNGRIIFWFASTNELCEQAASEFEHIFSMIGIGSEVNLTRLFGAGRDKLTQILDENKGIHIVVTNTEHFTELGHHYNKKRKDGEHSRYLIDVMSGNQYFEFIAKNTIAIIVDEAHEITNNAYQRFLAAMGFDLSGRKESKINFSQKNIVLIGLTATAYKGSGINEYFQCQECEKEFFSSSRWNEHKRVFGHQDYYQKESDSDEDEPDELKNMNIGTKIIHKSFQNNIYVPLPEKNVFTSRPVAIIDAPSGCLVDEYIKISGTDSFDRSSDLDFEWEITTFGKNTIKNDKPYFSHKFSESGSYTLTLIVRSKKNPASFDKKSISINVINSKNNFKGSLKDNEEFYRILTEKQILCPIYHGVVRGTRIVNYDEKEKKQILTSGFSVNTNKTIMTDSEYNKKILEIVQKCLKIYNRKKILIFANSVNHAYEIAQILKIKYKIKADAVNGNTKPGTRRKIIKRFKDEDLEVLVNFGVLTTGFDVPQIDTVIISRLVLVNSLMTQMIGRGQRGLKSNGSEDLWLITSDFPNSNPPGSQVKLGWEVTAEQWLKFSESIKDELKVTDFNYQKSPVSDSIPFKKEKDITKEIVRKDAETSKQKFFCINCQRGVEKQNLGEFFGFPKEKNVDFIIKLFTETADTQGKRSKFRELTGGGKCHSCRMIEQVMLNSNCEFSKKFVIFHNFDSDAVKIGEFLKNNEKPSNFHIMDIIQNSRLTFESIHKFVDKILTISNSEVFFDELKEPETLSKLMEIIKMDVLFKVSEEVDDSSSEKSINNLSSLFNNYKIILGHIPTQRQFENLIEQSEFQTEYEEKFLGRYEELLHHKKIILKNDTVLENLLLDEYFEKALELGRHPTSTEIDRHGIFRLKDYQQFYGSYNLFFEFVRNIIKNRLETENLDLDIANLIEEISKIKRRVGKSNFSNLLTYCSKPQNYINDKCSLTSLNYLDSNHQNFKNSDLESIARIYFHYIKLVNLLNSPPLPHVFIRFLDNDSQKFFSDNYKNDLKMFEIENGFSFDSISLDIINRLMTESMENKLKIMNDTDSNKLEKIIAYITSDRNYNELEIEFDELEFCILVDNYVGRNYLNNFI